jgi:hypothetical protein
MAALREEDLRKILGDDYRELQLAAQRSSGLRDEQLAAKARIESLEGRRFSGFAMALIGAALFVTAYFGAKGTELMVEDIFAGLFLVGGIGLMAYAMSQIKPLRRVASAA